jgi:hypothetical protein
MFAKFDVIQPTDAPALMKAAKRKVHSVFWHCSASDRVEHDSAEVMEVWHKKRKFAEIGYHAFVRKDGSIQLGRDWSKTPAAQEGHNTGTLAFCLHGLELKNFTAQQQASMHNLSNEIAKVHPDMRFRGHREVAAKLCPVVDYKAILRLGPTGRMNVGVVVPETTPAAPVFAHGSLRIFDSGPEVKRLQERLNFHGEALTTDGAFGRATHAAVLRFQRDNELIEDGIVGPATWAILGR